MFLSRLLILLFASLQLVCALQLTEKKINDVITLTLVHDGKDAMMTHAEAIVFCNSLARKKKQFPVVQDGSENEDFEEWKTTEKEIHSIAETITPLTIESMNATKSMDSLPAADMPQSDLISIHDPGMVAELMQWILNVERRQFWIGGMIKKVLRPFENYSQHIIHLWSDRTPTNFRFLHFPNEELGDLPEGSVRCLSVDYASGKWGVHHCDEKMYFVCATITPPTRMKMVGNDDVAVPATTMISIIQATANEVSKVTTAKVSAKSSTMKPTSSKSSTEHP